MKRLVFMILLVSCICSLAIPGICGQVSLDNQSLSDFETLYNSYKAAVPAKSQYETQAQYETRVKNFFQNDPVRYFELSASTYYVADTQKLYVFFYDFGSYAGSCPDITLPQTYQGLPLKESYSGNLHYLTIDNPNEMGLEKGKSPNPSYSSLNVIFVYNKNLIPSEAQTMATNIGLRIGIKFNYRAGGMSCDRYTAGHFSSSYDWIDGYSSYSLLGSFQLITLYNTQDKSIYLQKNVNDLSSPPVANAGADQIVFDKITLDASQSSDPNNDIVSYQWQLQYRGNSAYNRTAEGVNATVSNLQKGFYDVTLTVTDKNGTASTAKMMFSATGSVGGIKGDVNDDGKIGLEDAIYVLQVVSGIRNQ